jgi:hypothetical protein
VSETTVWNNDFVAVNLGTSGDKSVSCPAGMVAVSGGYNGGSNMEYLAVLENAIFNFGGGQPNTYAFEAQDMSTGQAAMPSIEVVCAAVGG